MTTSTVVHTDIADSGDAGTRLGSEIARALGSAPDAVILFASTKHDYPELLSALDAACEPKVLVGGSSAGEFTSRAQGEGLACAVALRAPDMRLTASIGRGLRGGRSAAAKGLVAGFTGMATSDFAFRTALVLTDATAGHSESFVDEITLLTAGTYQFFGAGVGGDAKFESTHVFFGTEAAVDAVVALEILSNKPLGIGISHGWKPASDAMRVTEAEGGRLVSLNAAPAAETFQEHAATTQQPFDVEDPLPFFLHNIVGVESAGGHKLRVPLAVNPDASVVCATEVPQGATVRIMGTTAASASEAARKATAAALEQLRGHRPNVALVFDCVATRLRLGKEFKLEIDAVKDELSGVQLAGCNSIGQIARAEGQFSGFHNCTAVVCVLPE